MTNVHLDHARNRDLPGSAVHSVIALHEKLGVHIPEAVYPQLVVRDGAVRI